MRIVILTSHRKGTASYCLPRLLERTDAEIAMVVLNEGHVKKKWKHYKNKIRKVLRIGIAGAINGIRIRSWFNTDQVNDTPIPDIETLCQQHNVPFQTTPLINCVRTEDLFRSCKPDLGISLGNSYIGSKVFSIPANGMINIHGEILPQFKNAQSIIWQLHEGFSETGYTIHKIDKEIDTGHILLQEKFPIIFKDTLKQTVSTNCSLILQNAADGLVKVINDYPHYNEKAFPQGKGKSFTTPSILQFFKIRKQFQKLKQFKA